MQESREMSTGPNFNRNTVSDALSDTAKEKELAAGCEKNEDYKGAVEHLKRALSAQKVAVDTLREAVGML